MSNPKIDEFGNKWWYNKKFQLHRLDGPAVEWKDGEKIWRINGKWLTKEEYFKELPKYITKEKLFMLRLKYE